MNKLVKITDIHPRDAFYNKCDFVGKILMLYDIVPSPNIDGWYESSAIIDLIDGYGNFVEFFAFKYEEVANAN